MGSIVVSLGVALFVSWFGFIWYREKLKKEIKHLNLRIEAISFLHQENRKWERSALIQQLRDFVNGLG